MNRNISFALNQIIAPNSSLKEFVFLSKKLGIETIEIRNDVATNLINENKPYKLRDFCEKNFLKILTINALQKFNLWNNDRLNELRKLCKFASSAGIQAIVLVPLNDGAVNDINAIRMRTQEGFPNFGEVDDLMNFEQIQVGLQAEEDEWAYTHRGLGLPDRFSVDELGTIKGPATDEVFLREYFKEYRRLMTTEPNIQITRDV